MKATLPLNEPERLNALRAYDVLDTPPDQGFDEITLLASHICETSTAMISLVDERRQWFKSKVGIAEREIARDMAFCAHGILQPDVFVVNDARADVRFADNLLVTGKSQVRFYAGAPLVTAEGYALGMLCVMDESPRELSPEQKLALLVLSQQVVDRLELQRKTRQLEQTTAELKRVETELICERNLLSALMDNSDDSIYFKDLESRFVRCSANMAKLFRVQFIEEMTGKRDSDFCEMEHANAAFADEQEIIRTGQPVKGKMEMETWPDGRVTWALTSKMPFRNKAGEIVGTCGISKDITPIKTAEEKLDQVHKQLVTASRQAGMAEIATSVLHNVGNVLNSVNVSSSLIGDKLRKSKGANLTKVAALIHEREADLADFFARDPKGMQLPGYLMKLAAHMAQEQEEILHEVGSLAANINHIKEIVSMQQNYATASGILESLKVTDLVEDALRINSSALVRHRVRVEREFCDLAPIAVDKHKVLQILVNIIRNAKYACSDSPEAEKRITVRVTNGNNRIKISIIDNGIGIPPENITRIFNHGFTTRKDGHGFGLHSGALAAKEMGGALTAFSEGAGCGAAFTLELPTNRT